MSLPQVGQELDRRARDWGLRRILGEPDSDLRIRIRERSLRPLSVGPGEQTADGGFIVTAEEIQDIHRRLHESFSWLFDREPVIAPPVTVAVEPSTQLVSLPDHVIVPPPTYSFSTPAMERGARLHSMIENMGVVPG